MFSDTITTQIKLYVFFPGDVPQNITRASRPMAKGYKDRVATSFPQGTSGTLSLLARRYTLAWEGQLHSWFVSEYRHLPKSPQSPTRVRYVVH